MRRAPRILSIRRPTGRVCVGTDIEIVKATDVLRRDHAGVSALIEELIGTADDQRRSELVATIAIALEIHAQIEEELFYPCFAALSGLIPEARRQHAQMRSLVANIECLDPTSPDFILEVGQLRDTLQLHVAEEEGTLFREAEQLGVDELETLGRHLETRKQALMAAATPEELRARKIA